MRNYVILVVSLVSTLGRACTCSPPHEEFETMRAFAEWRLEKAMVVFEGRVQSIEIQHRVSSPTLPDVLLETPSIPVLTITFQVTRAHKGPSKGVLEVVTGMGMGDCGFQFEIGKSYLVAASKSTSGELFTSICHATRELDLAGPYLRVLRKEPPTGDDLLTPKEYWEKTESGALGKICGSITHRDRTPTTRSVTGSVWRVLNSPVPPPKYADLHIDPDGSFCSDPVPCGHYIVGAQDEGPSEAGVQYAGYFPGSSRSDSIEVRTGEKKSGVEIRLERQPLYTVQGRVATLSGKLDQSQELRVGLRSSDDELADPDDTAIESDGTFEFDGVPPGRYSLSLIEYAETTRKQKWMPAKIDIVVPQQISGIALTITPVR